MLRALEAQWLDHPPVHYLVAAYLQYKKPDLPDVSDVEDQATPAKTDWLAGMGRSLPAPADLAAATNSDDALASLERMFFGEVHEL